MMRQKKIGPVVLVVAILAFGGALVMRSMIPQKNETGEISSSKDETSGQGLPPKTPGNLSEKEPSTLISGPAGELRVRVTANGSRVSGAQILALFPAAGMRRKMVTDEMGVARFEKLPIGEWNIGVRHSLYIPTVAEAEVREGTSTEIAVELKQGALLHGRVTDMAGTAIQGVNVTLFHSGKQISPIGQGLNAKTDETGAYQINGIPIRNVIILFSSPRYKPRQEQHTFTYAGEEVAMNTQLVEGNMIRGKVTDQGGIAIPDVTVTARNELAKAKRTDEKGQFTIYGLGDEKLHLSAGRSGFGTVYLHDVEPNTMDLVIRLPVAGSIRGKIMANPPPPWFAVNLWKYDTYYKKDVRVKSDSFEHGKNQFLLRNVTPGEYTLKVVAPGFLLDKAIPITVAEGQETSGILVPLRKK